MMSLCVFFSFFVNRHRAHAAKAILANFATVTGAQTKIKSDYWENHRPTETIERQILWREMGSNIQGGPKLKWRHTSLKCAWWDL